jgi:hypothetical protein
MSTEPQPHPVLLLGEIAKQAFTDALEICCLIENIERQNAGRIVTTLSERGAGNAAIVIRNSMVERVVTLVSRCYGAIHKGKGDLHLRRAFDEILKDPGVRHGLDKQGTTQQLHQAEAMWQALLADPEHERVKHFRDKTTAHIAERNPKIGPLNYDAFFDFAKRTARLMEQLAHAVGITHERLDEHFDDFAVGAQNFWDPWDPAVKS